MKIGILNVIWKLSYVCFLGLLPLQAELQFACPDYVFSGTKVEVSLSSDRQIRDFSWRLLYRGDAIQEGRLSLQAGQEQTLLLDIPQARKVLTIHLELEAETHSLTVVPPTLLERFQGEWRGIPPQVYDPEGKMLTFFEQQKLQVRQVTSLAEVKDGLLLIAGVPAQRQATLEAELPRLLQQKVQVVYWMGNQGQLDLEWVLNPDHLVIFHPASSEQGFRRIQRRGRHLLQGGTESGPAWETLLIRGVGSMRFYPVSWPDNAAGDAKQIYWLNQYFTVKLY